VSEQVVRSQSGRIVAKSLTSGGQGYAAQYSFDAASRMTQAVLSVNGVTDPVLDYGFDTTSAACAGFTGAVANAGVNGNRTTFSDAHTTGGVTTTSSTTYCYDAADRLLGSVVSGDVVPEANPIADGLTASELAYDAHGNTTTFADQVLVFDVANRHVSTTVTPRSHSAHRRRPAKFAGCGDGQCGLVPVCAEACVVRTGSRSGRPGHYLFSRR